MTAEVLLQALREHRVDLWTDGAELRYRAPKGALTPELRAAMAEHKAELLELVDERLRTTATDLVTVAELLVAGQMLNWCTLPIGPHLAIRAGEAAWLKFLECPPPGAVEAALRVAKRRVEEVWPL